MDQIQKARTAIRRAEDVLRHHTFTSFEVCKHAVQQARAAWGKAASSVGVNEESLTQLLKSIINLNINARKLGI